MKIRSRCGDLKSASGAREDLVPMLVVRIISRPIQGQFASFGGVSGAERSTCRPSRFPINSEAVSAIAKHTRRWRAHRRAETVTPAACGHVWPKCRALARALRRCACRAPLVSRMRHATRRTPAETSRHATISMQHVSMKPAGTMQLAATLPPVSAKLASLLRPADRL